MTFTVIVATILFVVSVVCNYSLSITSLLLSYIYYTMLLRHFISFHQTADR